jgi:hypothetical protein
MSSCLNVWDESRKEREREERETERKRREREMNRYYWLQN